MRNITLTWAIPLVYLIFCADPSQNRNSHFDRSHLDTIPSFMQGTFEDDYGIKYTITDSSWEQHPGNRYRILRSNHPQQYLVLQNDSANHTEGGLFTRIDYLKFADQGHYTWGYCLTVYNAVSDSVAEKAPPADRVNPRKGCNGFPFSRMKKSGQ